MLESFRLPNKLNTAVNHVNMKLTVFNVIFVCSLIVPAICNRINSKLYEDALTENQNHIIESASDRDYESQERQSGLQPTQPTIADHTNGSDNRKRNDNMLAYVKTSIPIRIFQCMQRLNILKCMKIFILQRMERTPQYLNSGNVTADFLDQILANNQPSGSDNGRDPSQDDILDKYYLQMPEVEINERLLKSFQRFFHDREIKLHFVPGMVVKVVPNEENSINLSLKRGM